MKEKSWLVIREAQSSIHTNFEMNNKSLSQRISFDGSVDCTMENLKMHDQPKWDNQKLGMNTSCYKNALNFLLVKIDVKMA